jgi:hypothetical protein
MLSLHGLDIGWLIPDRVRPLVNMTTPKGRPPLLRFVHHHTRRGKEFEKEWSTGGRCVSSRHRERYLRLGLRVQLPAGAERNQRQY